jgi:hypothetical protein
LADLGVRGIAEVSEHSEGVARERNPPHGVRHMAVKPRKEPESVLSWKVASPFLS